MTTGAESFIPAQWSAPPNVRAMTTTRHGGVSQGPFGDLNLSYRVGDEPQCVAENRARVSQSLSLPGPPQWLRQVHGATVVDAVTLSNEQRRFEDLPEADASYSKTPQVVCAISTADCLPVLLCDRGGTQVAAAHGGWRGLVGGVLEAIVAQFKAPQEVLAWLGPGIGAAAYEIDVEVRQAFVDPCPQLARAFTPTRPGHWLADLYAIARYQLLSLGVHEVTGGDYCTYGQSELFYSYRRAQPSGRMGSFIWLDS